MPYFVPVPRLREVRPPRFRNSCWENWGLKEAILGLLLTILGVLISITEIVRIIYGVTNRGINNYSPLDGRSQFPAEHSSLLYQVNPFPTRVEKFHYWPWSYAANLFGLVAIFAGVSGIISGLRRSYSTLFVFMSLSLLTALLSGYLIGYYSILINYYTKTGLADSTKRPASVDTTWGLIGFNLAISCALVALSIVSFFASCCGIRGCQAKGLHLDDTKPPYIEPAGAKGKIVPTSYLG